MDLGLETYKWNIIAGFTEYWNIYKWPTDKWKGKYIDV